MISIHAVHIAMLESSQIIYINPIMSANFPVVFLHSDDQHPRNLQGHHAYANPVLALAGAQVPWPKWVSHPQDFRFHVHVQGNILT